MKTPFLTIVCLTALPAFSEVRTSFSSVTGLELERPLDFGIEQTLGFNARFGLLTKDHPLLEDNNLSMSVEAALSPVSLCGKYNVSLTPVAFLKVGGSVLGGYGWSIFGDCHGTGINGITGKVYVSGLVLETDLYIQLQAETKDLLHNDNLNFQALIKQQVTNRYFSSASKNQSWIFQDDDGENLNGWTWDQIFFFGYEYPFSATRKLTLGTMVSLSTHVTHRADSQVKSGGWGSDFFETDINPLVIFQVKKGLECVFLLNFERQKFYKDKNSDLPFMMREFDHSEIKYDKMQAQIKYVFGRKSHNWRNM